MWPAYLAALLLSLPVAPATGRDATQRSSLDRAHLGEDGLREAGRAARAALPEEDDEDASEGDDAPEGEA
ncbi:hypothetical protein EJV46_07765 [Roseococcus sp. SYP-B2431]|uniref:hypothetical protein n=1 Tax=Roseococcus sp. SYP-B2431 TaxID=2496640 RepID=UPI00103DA153|nr:hypothetical protein [Roseococcus sp. SYP-B2431]TCI00517.1 hypothetical protein EJV46_07765 [Roseococcus sp. SYP-B2431]